MRLIMRWGCAPTEWAPDRIRKSKIECSRKEVYCVRKRNAHSSTLFEGLETIPTRFVVCCKDGQQCNLPLLYPAKLDFETTICLLAHLRGSEIGGLVRDTLREFLQKDHAAQNVMNLVKAGKTRQFWVEEDLLVTKGNRLYVPRVGDLRKKLLYECHDTLWAGHPGWQRTYALLKKGYFWPNMRDDVMQYTKTCLICQQDKVEKVKVAGLLDPLPVPTRPWKSVSMDFITHLPKVGDFEAILVIIDRFSKYATFIPTTKQCSAEMTAQLFFKHVVKLWGVPKSIVSDRDGRFIGFFWTELFFFLGTSLNISSSYHPQTDGQTERFNCMLEEYLRHFVNARQRLVRKYEGPVEVLKKRNIVTRPIIDLSQKEDKDVEEILAERVRRGRRPARRIHEYLVKWKNLPVEETSWERVKDLEAWKQKIEDFKLRQLTGTSTILVGENVKGIIVQGVAESQCDISAFSYASVPRPKISICTIGGT
ncbi:reverse transcriptase [Cucumis melo var. makuwa]|uniref:Reverse transcriptase n=1 Tax=Cucumis melo var. makuwa TaxID=1194695 RepID=A0A5A7VLK4_CUCMM|nr:reverse transcriptase [Cucumis melo var. makuwa]